MKMIPNNRKEEVKGPTIFQAAWIRKDRGLKNKIKRTRRWSNIQTVGFFLDLFHNYILLLIAYIKGIY